MHHGERGLSQSVQLAVVWPVLILLSLGLLQAGLWLHARNVVHRAATAAVVEAGGSYGEVAAAEELAGSLARAGGLDAVSVRVQRTATVVTATVTAQPPTMLDVGLGPVSETASGPVERVTTP